MAKNKISEWSATAANNTDIGGIDIAEGCAPSGINNAIRELMAQVKDQQTGTDADNFTVGGNLTVNGTAAFTSLSLTGNTVVGDTSADTLTVNATPTFNVAIPVTSGGTGVTTSTGTGAVVRAVSPSLTTPVLGTPASGTLTSCTGLPLTTGVTGTLPVLNGGTGVTTSTGTGNNVLSTSPTLVTPVLGTPSSGTLTSCTGLPLTTGVTGILPVANGGTGVTTSTGSGANALATSPTLVTPLLGTPTSGTLTNCTGLPMTTGVTGTLPVANGGTGSTTSTGSGSVVLATSPTLVTPALGTPSALVGTNITGTASGLSIGGTALALSTASGSAPSYSNRAWVNFNGTGTVAIRASQNVSSITDNGAGDYTINFTTAMPDADYSVSGAVNGWSTAGMNNGLYSLGINALTTSSARVYAIGTNGGGNNTAFYINDTSIITATIAR
jgi:hypothetical protein